MHFIYKTGFEKWMAKMHLLIFKLKLFDFICWFESIGVCYRPMFSIKVHLFNILMDWLVNYYFETRPVHDIKINLLIDTLDR